MDIFSTSLVLYLISALIHVESKGNPDAIGDNGQAYGVLQMHQIYLDDVERISARIYTIDDIKDEANAREACYIYMLHYGKVLYRREGRQVTLEDLARMHNGGPDGYKQDCTKAYWAKVRVVLDQLTDEQNL